MLDHDPTSYETPFQSDRQMSVFEHLHMPSLGEAPEWLSQRLWRQCAALAVVAMLLLAPSAAIGGGDEDHVPPSAGRRALGRSVRQEGPVQAFRNTSLWNSARCGRRAGLGARPICGAGPLSGRDSTGARLPELSRRCARPGRRLLRPRVTAAASSRCSWGAAACPIASSGGRQGLPLHGAALYPIRGDYEANVACVKGSRRIDHSYTLFRGGRISGGDRAGAAGRLGQPALQRDQGHERHRAARLPDR